MKLEGIVHRAEVCGLLQLRFRVFFLGLLLILVSGQPLVADPPPVFAEKLATASELADLRGGGYVLYLRHGRTDATQPDRVPIDLADCSTQRPLTDLGREEIRMVGVALRSAGVPVSEVFSSPLCRAEESAELAFGPGYRVKVHLMYTAHLTSAEKRPILAETRRLISLPVAEEGKNRVLVAHAPNLADLMNYFPETEGTLVIFRPLGNLEFEYVASILPGQWAGLFE